MSPTALELVDLVARWTHVIAGIMWIGNSLLWNWLDRNLEPPRAGAVAQSPAPIGSIWLLHSGAFYHLEKTLLTGAALPRPLHWFKWQAYTTWWSGVALLIAVYWLGGRATLTDPAVSDLTHRMGVLVAVGGIGLASLLYESAHRIVAPRVPRVAAALWVSGVAAIAFAFTQLLGGRAAFLHVGAMIGTLMAGNVVFTIMPAQRALVATVAGGGAADPASAAVASARAKRVSIDNNYFVFPVIALMLAAHFPALYSHPRNWLVLAVLVAGGASVRLLMNSRFTFAGWRPALAAAVLVTIGSLYALLRTTAANRPAPVIASEAAVEFATVRHIIDRRCGSCHAAEPSDLRFGVNAGGIHFDTPAQIVALAARIAERAVVTRTMPPANSTRMTDAERALLGRWIAERASLPAQLPR